MLETENLILHSGSPNDWESLYTHFWSKPEVFTCLFQKPCLTPETARKKTAAYAQMHRQVPTEFFVYEKSTGDAIGLAGIKAYSPTLYTVTDIALGPDFCRRGYGRQILQALTQYALKLGAERILYNCFRENLPSQCLATACGYRHFKTEEAELKKDGETVWLDYYEYVK